MRRNLGIVAGLVVIVLGGAAAWLFLLPDTSVGTGVRVPRAAGQVAVIYYSEDNPPLIQTGDIYLIDGARERRLTRGGGAVDLAWSADGERLAFAYKQPDENDFDLYVMDLRRGSTTRLTDNDLEDQHPAWSPDGAQIVFSGTRADAVGPDIFRIDAAGGERVPLTDGDALDFHPVAGESGVAYLSVTAAETTVNVLDGDEVRSVGTCAAADCALAWTESGLLYSSAAAPEVVARTDGGGDIFLDGAALTDDPAADMMPVMSPDGAQIAFVSNRDGNFDLYVMAADGGNLRRITDTPDDEAFPQWSPDGATILVEIRGDVGALRLIDVASGEARPLLATERLAVGGGRYRWRP